MCMCSASCSRLCFDSTTAITAIKKTNASSVAPTHTLRKIPVISECLAADPSGPEISKMYSFNMLTPEYGSHKVQKSLDLCF